MISLRRPDKNKMKFILTIAAAITAMLLLDNSLDITTAAAEAGRWREVIISNKTVLFFFNLILIGVVGGAISSRYKHRKVLRLSIMVTTWMIIYTVGFGLSQITTLPVDAGP